MEPHSETKNEAKPTAIKAKAQPWKTFISVSEDRSIQSEDGEVRLQTERDQHKTIGGPICTS